MHQRARRPDQQAARAQRPAQFFQPPQRGLQVGPPDVSPVNDPDRQRQGVGRLRYGLVHLVGISDVIEVQSINREVQRLQEVVTQTGEVSGDQQPKRG